MSFPDFYKDAPVVRTRDPLARLLGASSDGELDYCYADAVRLAGHSCPTVAGAFLTGRAALAALYPGVPAERGGVTVRMPAPCDEGVTGVIGQVLTLLTGAAAENGFHGLGRRHRRSGLLSYASQREGEAIVFARTDTGARIAVSLDLRSVPASPQQGALLGAALQNPDDQAAAAAFADAWQARVRCLLLEHADDPQVVRVEMLTA